MRASFLPEIYLSIYQERQTCIVHQRSTMLAPNSVLFEDKELTMFSFTQLEQLSNKILRGRAWAMRDQLGADRLPPVPQNNDAIIMWILDTQTAISRTVGQEYTIYDFGYPKNGLPTIDDKFFDPQPAMGEFATTHAQHAPELNAILSPGRRQGACADARRACAGPRRAHRRRPGHDRRLQRGVCRSRGCQEQGARHRHLLSGL